MTALFNSPNVNKYSSVLMNYKTTRDTLNTQYNTQNRINQCSRYSKKQLGVFSYFNTVNKSDRQTYIADITFSCLLCVLLYVCDGSLLMA